MTEPKQPTQSGWPQAGAFPFMPFPVPGATGASTPGLGGGIDLIKDFWSRLPGGSALPGFLLPTVDVEELDKRIGDLKAAEQWVEVNLNMLRMTIQGLQIQRHTVAALQALTTPVAQPGATPDTTRDTGVPPGWPASPASAPETPAAMASAPAVVPPANQWLDYLQAQFSKVAQAASTPAASPPRSPAAKRRKVAKKAVARKVTSPR